MIWKAKLEKKVYQHSTTCQKERTEQKGHEPWNKAVSSPPEDVEEGGKKRHADNKANGPAFQEICDE
jgi:hypothetical protein